MKKEPGKFKKFFTSSKFWASVLFLLAGFGLGVLFTRSQLENQFENSITIHKIHPSDNTYKYIDPLLAVDVGDVKEFSQYQPLQAKITAAITQAKAGGQVSDIGVYFRDLESGRWTGVNQDDKFAPGSLGKVALMIAYYKAAETNPGILNQTAVYTGQQDANQSEGIKPAVPIVAGKTYTNEQLIESMIEYSDNNAENLLVTQIDPTALSDILSDLNIPASSYETTNDSVSPKQLSLMFRVLYNATYLTEGYSEQALGILSQVNFKNGLVAGVPQNIDVAHKFGEREIVDAAANQTTDEFHDCGIVYYPSHPYFLCVMTKGANGSLPVLQSAIKSISSVVYSEVAGQYK